MAQSASNPLSTKLWGEVDLDPSSGPKGKTPIFHRRVHSIPVPECGQRKKLRCLQKPSLYEDPPEASRDADKDCLPRDCKGRNLVLHSIDLRKFIETVKDLYEQKKNERDPSDKGTASGDIPSPDFPTKNWKPEGPSERKLPRLPSENHQISLPKPASCSEEASAMLRHGLVTQCSFTGYDATRTRAIDVLVDVTGAFLTKLCTAIQSNTEHIRQRRNLGFQDAIEQSLRECMSEGRNDLHQYWQMYIVRYASLLNQKALEMQQDYQRLTAGPSVTSDATSQKNVKKRLPSNSRLDTTLLLSDGQEVASEGEEEISLDTLRQQADNMKSPDLPSFTPHPTDTNETFDFAIDGPSRKRSRTSSSDRRTSKDLM